MLSAYLDGELSEAERADVEKRLAEDAGAQQALAEMRSVSETLRSMPRETLDSQFVDAVVGRIEQRAATPESTDPDGFKLSFGRSPRWWLWAGLAVAAALLLMVSSNQVDDRNPELNLAKAPAAAAEGRADRLAGGPNELRPAKPRREATARVESASGRFAVAEAEDEAPAPASPATAAPAEDLFAASEAPRMEAFGFESDLDTQPVAPAQLLVRVRLRREAFDNRFVDTVLANQGIAVANQEESESLGVAGDARLPAVNSARRLATPTFPQAAPRGEASRAVLSRARGASSGPQENDADYLIVDAPAPSFAACLNDLKLDVFNCASVEVEPAEPATESERPTRAKKGETADHLAVEEAQQSWRLYNRLAPADESQPPYGGLRLRLNQQQAQWADAAGRDALRRQSIVSGEGIGGGAGGREAMLRDSSRRWFFLPAPTDEKSSVQALMLVEPAAVEPPAAGAAKTKKAAQ